MSAAVIAFPVRHEKSDADYIRERIESLLSPWGLSELSIRAAQRKALNMRRDYRDLSNDECVWRVVAPHRPGSERA